MQYLELHSNFRSLADLFFVCEQVLVEDSKVLKPILKWEIISLKINEMTVLKLLITFDGWETTNLQFK